MGGGFSLSVYKTTIFSLDCIFKTVLPDVKINLETFYSINDILAISFKYRLLQVSTNNPFAYTP